MGVITNLDLTQVLLYVFWAFFAYLLFYLQRETRREGYPLETDETGAIVNHGVIFMPEPKKFKLPHGLGNVEAPNYVRETRDLALKPIEPWEGSPKEPTGNPMLDGVGPAAYAERADRPDLTDSGVPRIVPMRLDDGFSVNPRDVNPIGIPVVGCDKKVAGTVADVWVDRSEHIIRYYEVTVGEGDAAKNVLLPWGFVVVKKRPSPQLYVHAIKAEQFADVPATKSMDQITLLEEEKIMGYFGGGLLYADWRRAEPYL